MTRPEIIVQRIHFEDRSGAEFERLCFAYLWHAEEWRSLEWYGQSGSDSGRDVWGLRRDGSTHPVQCANYARLSSRKAATDLSTIAAMPHTACRTGSPS
jgi:hypothetical protein